MGEPFVQCGWILGLWKRETLQQCTTVLHPSFAEQQALCFPPGVSISESIEICALYIVSNIACVHVCKYTHAAMYTVQINFFKQRWKKHPKIQASFPPKANASNASGSYAAQPLIPWGSHGLEKLLNVQCSQNAHEMLYYAILERNVIIEQKLSKESVFMLSHWVHYDVWFVLWLHYDPIHDFSCFMTSLWLWFQYVFCTEIADFKQSEVIVFILFVKNACSAVSLCDSFTMIAVLISLCVFDFEES